MQREREREREIKMDITDSNPTSSTPKGTNMALLGMVLRQTNRRTDTWLIDKIRDAQINIYTNIYTLETDIQTDGRNDGQTDRQTDRQTD